MISKETRKKLLEELQRSGNVEYSCRKVGISRAIFYYWLKYDEHFKARAESALELGRESTVDKVEQVMVSAALGGNIGAGKYILGHTSDRYREGGRNVADSALRELYDEEAELLRLRIEELRKDPANAITNEPNKPQPADPPAV